MLEKCCVYNVYRREGDLGGIIFCEKSKEGSGINFRGSICRDCCAVVHALGDPIEIVRVRKLVVISFRWKKIS